MGRGRPKSEKLHFLIMTAEAGEADLTRVILLLHRECCKSRAQFTVWGRTFFLPVLGEEPWSLGVEPALLLGARLRLTPDNTVLWDMAELLGRSEPVSMSMSWAIEAESDEGLRSIVMSGTVVDLIRGLVVDFLAIPLRELKIMFWFWDYVLLIKMETVDQHLCHRSIRSYNIRTLLEKSNYNWVQIIRTNNDICLHRFGRLMFIFYVAWQQSGNVFHVFLQVFS